MPIRLAPFVLRRAFHSKPTIQIGASLPSIPLKDLEGKPTIRLDELKGRNVIIGVPGAFTPVCSNQVPGYIENFDKFKTKGVKDIHVFSVNDIFVLRAWKDKLAARGTDIKFASDDKAEFVSKLGLTFDATAPLGSVRSKRFVLLTDSGKVTKVVVENVQSEVTVTAAEKLIEEL